MKIKYFLIIITSLILFQLNVKITLSDTDENIHKKRIVFLIDESHKNPTDGKLCNSIGFHYYMLKNYKEAIKYYNWAMKFNPKYSITYNNIGILYLKINDLYSAEKSFKKAIELNPDYVKAMCNLAGTYYKLKKYNEAKEMFKKAKEVDSDYVDKRVSAYKNKSGK